MGFIDEERGWAVRLDGTALTTTTAGRTWHESLVAPPELRRLKAARVWCQGDEVVWVLLTGGVALGNQTFAVLRTLDGGGSWQPALAHQVPSLGVPDIGPAPGGLVYVDESTAYFSIHCGPCNNGHYFMTRTNDAGATWESTVTLPGLESANSSSFPDPQHGWVAGRSYNPDDFTDRSHEPIILKTTDGGQTWTNLTLTFR